jgi:hypothetical protein
MIAKLYILWGGQYDVRTYKYDSADKEWYDDSSGNRVVKVGRKDPKAVIATFAKGKLDRLRTTGYLLVDGTKVVDKESNPGLNKWVKATAVRIRKVGGKVLVDVKKAVGVRNPGKPRLNKSWYEKGKRAGKGQRYYSVVEAWRAATGKPTGPPSRLMNAVDSFKEGYTDGKLQYIYGK